MKCPQCNKPTSDIGKKCVHCGRNVHEEIKRPKTIAVKCPVCKLNTEIMDLAGVELDYCYKCNGIWFDKGEMNVFQNAISDPNICSQMTKTFKELSIPNQHINRTSYLNCPVCSQPMLHKKFAEVSNIILDKCPAHGTWTEQEDLFKILKVINSGEIDELIAKAAKNNQQDLNNKLKKIEAMQNHLNMERAKVKRFSKIHFFLDLLDFF